MIVYVVTIATNRFGETGVDSVWSREEDAIKRVNEHLIGYDWHEVEVDRERTEEG